MGIMYKIYFDETASAELRSLAEPFGLTVSTGSLKKTVSLSLTKAASACAAQVKKAVSALILMAVPPITGVLKAEVS